MAHPHPPASRIERFSFTAFGEEKPRLAQKPVVAAKPVPPPEPVKPAPPPAPTFSEKDMEAARNEARERGYKEGYSAAEAKINKDSLEREEAVQGLLEVIANRITLAAEELTVRRREQESSVSKLALAIANKLTAGALKREPYTIAESLVHECMELIAGERCIVITVPAGRGDGLKQRTGVLTPMLRGFDGELRVEEDASLSEHDCRVQWSDGYAEHHAETVWNDIQAIINKTALIT